MARANGAVIRWVPDLESQTEEIVLDIAGTTAHWRCRVAGRVEPECVSATGEDDRAIDVLHRRKGSV